MDFGLRHKVVLVTAASKGLGRAIAQRFVEEGASTYICARTEDELQQTAKEIGAKPLVCDVTNQQHIETAVKQIGRIDVLVTNAGGPKAGHFYEITDSDWQSSFELTFLSAVRLIRAVLPGMQTNKWGRIICLTSTTVRQPIDHLITSNTMRAAVVNLAKTLSLDIAKDGITVNAVAPGMYDTERLRELIARRAEHSGYMFEEEEDMLKRMIPTKRFGEISELAAAVIFLASEQASYINGALLAVDGGMSKTP